MGTKEVILLLISFFHSCSAACLHPLGPTSSLAHMQGDVEYRGNGEHLSNNNGGGNVISSQSKMGHAFGGRGVDGGAGAGDSNGGGSQSYPQGGGAAVVPLYAAGAANAHRNSHHSAGVCVRNGIGSSVLAAIILACLLLNISEFE